MKNEIETKVLGVNKSELIDLMQKIGAKQVLNTKFTVDWFRPVEVVKDEDPWYLRIRTTSDGQSEITWKSKPEFIGISKQVKELNIPTSSPKLMKELFEAINIGSYAHQEKYRTSWTYKDWKFDLDEYPQMPPYLEIEGESESHLHEAIQLLGLSNHKSVSEGERTLIQNEYGLNWHEMRFDETNET